ncbi:hypothetical protein GGX14DRAFT_384142 [Mycena pura]|uniref:Carboxylesterase type B domain-containing protein n=1 Tax=Mycena pura TaxID=153505 RepID=A0AAD6VEP6_9AGAR|nr:hypothetical protein GGX14DRAFT_396456 [Mycena pura]KAJ7230184.1 hypothetical protein GGX14DRAFT_384142 [Mycena pura]
MIGVKQEESKISVQNIYQQKILRFSNEPKIVSNDPISGLPVPVTVLTSPQVVKPATATPTSNLPVVMWIFGGGFEIGSPSLYDGATIVERSLDIGKPVIFVSTNYRLSGKPLITDILI